METQEIITGNKYRTLADDPQYFGGYLNMARLNILNISNHVASIFGQAILDDEGKIPNSFLCNKEIKRLNWNYVFSKTVRYMPMLKVFDVERLPEEERINASTEGKDFISMSDTLKIIFGELQEFRNDYSHYYSIEKGIERKLTVSNELAIFLRSNFNRAIEYSKIRMKDVLSVDDYQLVENKIIVRADNSITTEGLVFLTCLFLEREHAFQFIGKIVGLKGTQFKSFIATREVLMAFCVRLPHDKFVSEDIKQALTLDMINELNRCPKTLYGVITEEEKRRFRPELDDQSIENLIENSTNDEEREKFFDEIEYEQYVEGLIKKVRYNNRFSYFALRYIDETNMFNKLRFQINLGKFVLDEYTKSFNGENIPRIVIENVKAFGKLSSFQDEEFLWNKIDKDKRSIGFEQFAPHYNDVNNRIGLSSREGLAMLLPKSKDESKVANNLKQQLPQAFLSLNELPKIILLDTLKKGKVEELINDFILLNDTKLMNMQFIEEIKAKLPSDWNEFAKRSDSKKKVAYSASSLKYLLQRKEVLNQILAGYHLNDKQIPTRILNYWLNIKEVEDDRSIADRIKLMKRDCMLRLKVLEKHKIDKSVKIPKIGEMASFLAMDIVDMIISKEKKHKVTSFYYDKIQECLALFADPEKKSLFFQLINNELMLNEQDGHPFLGKINFGHIKKTSQLYEAYLEEKAKKIIIKTNPNTHKKSEADDSWMFNAFYYKEWDQEKGKQLTVVKLPNNRASIPYTICQWDEKEKYDLKSWLQNVSIGKEKNDGKKVINLPTNLFDDAIIELLRNELDSLSVEYNPNAYWNELMKIWWKKREDSSQDFYNAEREYEVYDEKVRFVLNKSSHFSDYYQNSLNKVYQIKSKERINEKKINNRLPLIELKDIKKVFDKSIAQTEKRIRFLEEEDRMVLLMLENLMSSNLKLCKIETLLNNTTQIEQKIVAKLNFDDHGNINTSNTKLEIVKTIVAERKQKNHTELRKFVYDRRLPELFEFIESDVISLDQLQSELNMYNKAKQDVFDTVFKLESKIIEKDSESLKQLFVNKDGGLQSGNIQHSPYLEWLCQRQLINDHEVVFFNMIRNCFSHNQFPHKGTSEKFMEKCEENIAAQIANTYINKINDILIRLN